MASNTRSVVIHGHFYQPPREDPWLEELEAQPSAAPYHDWNARVEAECYRTVVAARIPGEKGRIRDVLNTLRFLSFDFGPTLLAWMEREAPRTYRQILDADRISREGNGGHGNAMAQAYHHTILPLASRRDKITEVRWGIEDFRRRFRRDPEGMWLPETATDAETLDVLAREGLAFTVVAPHQVGAVPKGGRPGLYRTESGRSIALFVYDGPLSHDVAFGPLLRNAEAWAARMAGRTEEIEEEALALEGPRPVEASRGREDRPGNPWGVSPPPPSLISIATDGETYGHHHRFGEMALAAVIQTLRSWPGVRLENYASFLSHTPPVEEVSLIEPTSWSCVHGVERWRSACGCKMEPGKVSQQEWRSGLRKAMDWLANRIHHRYEQEGPGLLGDPWEARNAYGRVVTGSEALEAFLDRRLPPAHSPPDRVRAAELLEMERNALRLFTSCGWFFDDLAGIEPVQILRYAARALELAGAEGSAMEKGFLAHLRGALSNEVPERDGATIFLEEAKPLTPARARVAAGAAALMREGKKLPTLAGFSVEVEDARTIRVTQVGTGRSRSMEVEVEGATPREFRIRVRDAGRKPGDGSPEGKGYEMGIQDLPAAFRVPLEEMVLREALDRWVSPEDQAALLAGTDTLGQVLSRAIVSAVRGLEDQAGDAVPDPATLNRVEELALLHTRRGLRIPFDAQTDFYRLMEVASHDRRAALSRLSGPMGFVLDR